MAKRKTEFKLKIVKGNPSFSATAKIVDYAGDRSYVFVDITNTFGKSVMDIELRGKSLETFALNILKALKSKHLRNGKV